MPYQPPSRIENIYIYQGTDYVGTVNMNAPVEGQCSTLPVNISGSTFTGQIVKDFNCNDVLATFSCSVVNASAGQFQINIPAANTATISTRAKEFNNPLTFQAMIGLYTINWYNPFTSTTTCLMYGQAYMIRNTNITQPNCN